MQRNNVSSCSMAAVDVLLSAREEGKAARQQRQINYAAKSAMPATEDQEHDIHIDSCSSSSTSSEEGFKVYGPNQKSQLKRPQTNILDDPDVAGALDRVNVPDRGATMQHILLEQLDSFLRYNCACFSAMRLSQSMVMMSLH